MDCHEWKSPGVVISQGDVVLFVRHGGTYVIVHQTKLRKVNKKQEKMVEPENENPIKTNENLFRTPTEALDEEHNASECEHKITSTSEEPLNNCESSFDSVDPKMGDHYSRDGDSRLGLRLELHLR